MYSLILQVLRYRKSFAICMHGSSVSFGGNTSSFCIPEKAFALCTAATESSLAFCYYKSYSRLYEPPEGDRQAK